MKRRPDALAPALALVALAAGAAPALAEPAADVLRSDRSLARQATRLTPAEAPATALQPRDAAGALAVQGGATRLAPIAGPVTLLRAAEVPPIRLERTRALLAALHAHATPQQAIAFDLPADVLFDFDRAQLRADAALVLERAAQLIQSYPRAPLRVVGHTDAKGGDTYNDALSLRRAQAVAEALRERTGRQAHVQGRGRSEPVAANTLPDGSDDPQGRQRNRRVQILIEPLGRASSRTGLDG